MILLLRLSLFILAKNFNLQSYIFAARLRQVGCFSG